MPAFLDHADPRLGLRAAQAGLSDMMTRAAIRLLGDALAQLGDGVIAAPALGLPVRVLAMRQGDATSYFLNPKIESLADVDLLIAETTPHTGPIRRNVLRAKTIVFHGTDLSGAQHTAELADGAAIQAQRAFDLMDQPAPFDWLTAYHHSLMREQDAMRRKMYLDLNAGLYAALPSFVDAKTPSLQFASENSVHMYSDDSHIAVAEIDALNPMRPTNARQRAQLSLMAALPGGRHAMFSSARQLDLAVAAALVFRDLTAHVAETQQWPQAAVDQLGLAAVLRRVLFDMADFPDPPANAPALDAIVIDTLHSGTVLPNHSGLRRMARALSGESGAFILSMDREDPLLEDRLQAVFPALYVVEPASDHRMYLALKTPLEVGQARGHLLARANATGLSFLKDLLAVPWVSLRKDGQRMPL